MNAGSLNEFQRRHLFISVKHADKLLSEIEGILAAATSKSPFPEYREDVTPIQEKVVRDYIGRIRAQMLRVLEGQGISPQEPQVGALHSIRVRLSFIDIALTELRPQYMKGYGKVPESAAAELEGLVVELSSLIGKLHAYLGKGPGQDLGARIANLQWKGDEADMLSRLERVISTQGLVEFRSRLAGILDRLENRRFEIAVFGLVSSGKSSLLNHILRVDVLPVGVNPITAVPTRIVFGPAPGLTVTFADGRIERLEVTLLPDFVTEQLNPANFKGVARIEVALPAKRLNEGIVFVDTPGLGSLATSGAAETRAYLPQCDLGVMLSNAGAALAEDDLATIRALYEAGVPASVLLSKADLLTGEDRESAIAYIEEQILAHLGLALKVHPISIVDNFSDLMDSWFEGEIAPLYDRRQELADESVRRKIAALRESVEAALQSKLDRLGGPSPQDVEKLKKVEKELRRAAGRIPDEASACLGAADEVAGLAPAALQKAALRIVETWRQGRNAESDIVTASLSETATKAAGKLYARLDGLARELTAALQHAARQLAFADPPQGEEFFPALREMPQPDFGAVKLFFRRSPLVSVVAPLLKAGVERRLHHMLDPGISKAFGSYSRLLNAWVRKAISEIHARFDLQADAYRAQFERLLGTYEAGPDTAEEIRRNMADIELKTAELDSQKFS